MANGNRRAYFDAKEDIVKFHSLDVHLFLEELLNNEYKIKTPANEIIYIGKDRSKGSRGQDFFSYMKMASEADFDAILYGKWNQATLEAHPYIKHNGLLPPGSNHVIDRYNRSFASLIVPNELYAESAQLTVRSFEVIGSKTLPLIDSKWERGLTKLIKDPSILKKLLITPDSTFSDKIKALRSNLGIRSRLISDTVNEAKKNCNYKDISYKLNSILNNIVSDFKPDVDYIERMWRIQRRRHGKLTVDGNHWRSIKAAQDFWDMFNDFYTEDGKLKSNNEELWEKHKENWMLHFDVTKDKFLKLFGR